MMPIFASPLLVVMRNDDATGVMEKNSAGKLAVTKIALRPLVVFSGVKLPDRTALDALHHPAHEECFIANSVKTEVRVAGVAH